MEYFLQTEKVCSLFSIKFKSIQNTFLRLLKKSLTRASQPWLPIRVSCGALKILVPGLHTTHIKRDSLGMRSRHQHFVKLPGWFQCAAKVEEPLFQIDVVPFGHCWFIFVNIYVNSFCLHELTFTLIGWKVRSITYSTLVLSKNLSCHKYMHSILLLTKCFHVH